MKKVLCSLRNRETGLYCDPFVSLNTDQAIARFTYACSVDYLAEIFHECDKYDLEFMAEFDDVTGELIYTPKLLIRGLSLVQQRDINREKYYQSEAIKDLSKDSLKSETTQ